MQGADASQGPGWWQASDGKWYPPEAQPGAAPTIPPAAPASGTSAAAPGGVGGAGSPSFTAGVEGGSFFKRLFDVSLTTFVTPSIIKLLFVLAIIGVTFGSVVMLITGLATFGDGGVVLVLLAPILWLIGIIYWRVILELVIVLFRIERNTRNDR
jgi:hypothetical protein